jgi:hypothetical protein
MVIAPNGSQAADDGDVSFDQGFTSIKIGG